MPVGFGVDRRRPARAVCLVALAAAVLAPVHAHGQESGAAVARRPLGRDVRVYQPAPGDPERRQAPPVENPAGPVSLRDAVALALLHNPARAAFA